MNARWVLPLALSGCLYDDDGDSGIEVTAAFSAAPLGGPAPLVVQFTDQSDGDVGAWTWTFGDGESSAFHSPVHTYTEPGTYTVQLHVTACASAVDCAHGWETKTDLITVTAAVASDPATAGAAPDRAAGRERVHATVPSAEASAHGIARAFRAPVRSPSGGLVILALVARCASRVTVHACSVEAIEARVEIGARIHPMRLAHAFPRATSRAEGPCSRSACHLLALPGRTWLSADARLVVELPAPDASDVEFALIAACDGLTTTVARGTLVVPRLDPAPGVGSRGASRLQHELLPDRDRLLRARVTRGGVPDRARDLQRRAGRERHR
jgi:PKD repeat protein